MIRAGQPRRQRYAVDGGPVSFRVPGGARSRDLRSRRDPVAAAGAPLTRGGPGGILGGRAGTPGTPPFRPFRRMRTRPFTPRHVAAAPPAAPVAVLAAVLAAVSTAVLATPLQLAAAPADSSTVFVRVNQLGYAPDAPKVAVACALGHQSLATFELRDAGDAVILRGKARAAPPFASCARTWRLDFSAVRVPGTYRLVAESLPPVVVHVTRDRYRHAADSLLAYMRQQRSGYNPLFHANVHQHDGIVVGESPRAGTFIPVSGGWADASDYLQYVTTSANATFVMLMAFRDHPRAFGDAFSGRGDPGANGVADILDEARHGLAWLLRMFPADTEMYNQLGDDRDHVYSDLPTTDSSDYGWGKGRERPVYPCTGRPQGLLRYQNRSTGYASTAGKYAAAFALGAQLLRASDPALADTLARKARAAYALGVKYPGTCQTAPGSAPYFYEEDNWVDDMELGAAQLHALTRDPRYLRDALAYAREEPVTPWMGADTARHYQWYPWHNNAHHEVWRLGSRRDRRLMAAYYRRGLEGVARRARANGFRVGVPFIWCSNNLMASFATQAYLYRQMTGDTRYREFEQAAIDWLFGTNPWGTSMVVGVPGDGRFARDPHSDVARQLGVRLTGGLLDGPVYRSIYQNLIGIRLLEADEYAPFNTGFIVYHDDYGDYSTNEPIMDGTANLTYLLGAIATGNGR